MTSDQIVQALRICVAGECECCPYNVPDDDEKLCVEDLKMEAANAIVELQNKYTDLREAWDMYGGESGITQALQMRDDLAKSVVELRHEIDMDSDIIRELDNERPRWISVNDKLPDEPGKYFVMGQWKDCPIQIWVCEFICIKGFHRGWSNLASNPPVKYWLPIPEPPKEET